MSSITTPVASTSTTRIEGTATSPVSPADVSAVARSMGTSTTVAARSTALAARATETLNARSASTHGAGSGGGGGGFVPMAHDTAASKSLQPCALSLAGALVPRKNPTRRAGAVPEVSPAPVSIPNSAGFAAPTCLATGVAPGAGTSEVSTTEFVDTCTVPSRPATNGLVGSRMFNEVPVAEPAFLPILMRTLTGASLDRIGTPNELNDVGMFGGGHAGRNDDEVGGGK